MTSEIVNCRSIFTVFGIGWNIVTEASPPSPSSRQGRRCHNKEESPTKTDDEEQILRRLRCPSESTEVISEREQRRRKRCANYPGLALGLDGSIFASDTMMKFSIIRNELHNVIKGQLKRVNPTAMSSLDLPTLSAVVKLNELSWPFLDLPTLSAVVKLNELSWPFSSSAICCSWGSYDLKNRKFQQSMPIF